MRVELNYNLEDVKSEFTPIPAADYLGRLDKFELAASKDGKPMIKAAWEVVDGEFAGRKLFDNVMLDVEWKVKQYCVAANIESGREFDTQDFLNTEAILSVLIEPAKDGYAEKNKINKVRPVVS